MRVLEKRTDGSFYVACGGETDATKCEKWCGDPFTEPHGARLVWIDASSFKFVPVGRSDPWWRYPVDDRAARAWPYKAGQYVETHCAHNTFWLGRIAPDPEGKDYVGSSFARVILDGNEVSERSYKTGMRPLSLLEVLAWASA